jgi:hypothetical protein
MGASAPTPRLNDLIVALLAGEHAAARHLYPQAERYARKVIDGVARGLPEDLRQDVFHQGLENLLKVGMDGLVASDLEPTSFFRTRLLLALRQVRAATAAPGARTRRRREAEVAVTTGLGRSRPTPPLETYPDPIAANGFSAVEHRRDAETILAKAPSAVATALTLICFGEREIGKAAAEVGLSRFALKRRIDSFAAVYRAAA